MKDTPYYELRDALLVGGCPLCRQGGRAARRYIESALYEGMTIPATRNRIRAAQGFCREHAWQMTHLRATVLGTSIVSRDVLNDLIEALSEAPAGRGFLGRGPATAELATPRLPCPACEVGEDEALRTGDVLRAHLADDEIGTAYRDGDGLCLPHLRSVLSRARSAEAEILRGWQLEVYRSLRGQLDELIRKHDYRFTQEPIGPEADAWQRAVARVVGEPAPSEP